LSRLVNIVVSCVAISIVSIFFGPEIHVHYYLLVAAAFPFLWLPRKNKLRYTFCGIAIFNWFLLICYYSTCSGLYPLNVGNTDFIKLVNDSAIIIFMLSLFYITTKEFNNELEKVKLKSRQIEEKNIELERFSFIASHDLKEPLRTVQSFSQIIRIEFKEHLNKDLNDYFKFIDDALVKMKVMIEGLQQYASIGKSNEAVNVDLNLVMNDLKSDLSSLISSNNATINYCNLPTITGDEFELRLLFQNLITNAIKFQQPNQQPVVEITFQNLAQFWQFCVADNGIGIEKENQKAIFNFLTKLHPFNKFEGQGLGLAFCKKIVEVHQGEIWVESVAGKGSEFYFTISKMRMS